MVSLVPYRTFHILIIGTTRSVDSTYDISTSTLLPNLPQKMRANLENRNAKIKKTRKDLIVSFTITFSIVKYTDQTKCGTINIKSTLQERSINSQDAIICH